MKKGWGQGCYSRRRRCRLPANRNDSPRASLRSSHGPRSLRAFWGDSHFTQTRWFMSRPQISVLPGKGADFFRHWPDLRFEQSETQGCSEKFALSPMAIRLTFYQEFWTKNAHGYSRSVAHQPKEAVQWPWSAFGLAARLKPQNVRLFWMLGTIN